MSVVGKFALKHRHYCRASVLLIALVINLVSFTLAQDIKIVVLNSKTSNPVTNECLNISLGQWHGSDLITPTDRTGIVTIHIDGNMVSADSAPAKACNGRVITGPKPFVESEMKISIEPDFYASCQEYGRPAPGEPLTRDTLPNMIPSYSIRAIREGGIFSGNSCSGLRAKAKPGELVIFVRALHWWEKAKL